MDMTGNDEIRRINKTLLTSWMVIILILLVAYSIEVVKGERTLEYIIQFGLIMIIPFIITMFIYQKNRSWEYLCYVVVVGYTFMYTFVMFTGITQMVSSYILPLLCFLVLYHKPGIIIFSFFITLSVNIASLIYQLNTNAVTVSNSNEVEIRFAVIIVSFAGGLVSARLYNSIHNENKMYTKELSEKNQEIQDMAIQTIATIANTIDAKDEYTRGHSKRVAEYSVAIAKEIGMSAEEINNLRSIALLHDIGKIGVPDSVLNKPGRLTADEYDLMKQHTVMGSEILKDIKMFHGIDIGARYHHERYDGNGYPEKKVGEEIPQIARIIAVADAFDAMTSNRVYRKHLDMEYVLEELKKCRGTQFDPEFDDALVRMIEEGRLQTNIVESDDDVSEMSKIWTRVMQKDEEKYKGKSISDDLTGLFNRGYGEKMITAAVEAGKGAFIAIDVDRFRRINGKSGFLLGDIILRIVARCLEKIECEKILSRYGGDEFVAFLPNVIEKVDVETILDKFYEDIKEQSRQMKEPVDFTVSSGVCLCTQMQNVYQSCFLEADRALYMSKRDGGNCYTFFEKVN
ncbi:MAG: diguanylate cyclase, partial [Eubacteriales bacterium]|nr:diguanylate cyclase [Eubacteriales bacterium]